MLKQIISTIIVLAMLTTPTFAEEIYIDWDGFCPTEKVHFEFYNKTQYENDRHTIKRKLCKKNENPKYDKCLEFQKIDLKIEIYDGPSDFFGSLHSKVLIDENKAEFIFPKSNDYLIEIDPITKGFEKKTFLLPIEKCSHLTNKKNNTIQNNSKTQINITNTTQKFNISKTNQTNTTQTTKIKNPYEGFLLINPTIEENYKKLRQTYYFPILGTTILILLIIELTIYKLKN